MLQHTAAHCKTMQYTTTCCETHSDPTYCDTHITSFDPRRCKVLSWSERRTAGPEVAGSIPAKLQNRELEFLKFTFEHIELRAKLIDYFLRSNKSNINQSTYCNRMQHTATHCDTHIDSTYCNTMQQPATYCDTHIDSGQSIYQFECHHWSDTVFSPRVCLCVARCCRVLQGVAGRCRLECHS